MNFSKFNDQRVITFFRDIKIPFRFYPKLPYIIRALMLRQKRDYNTFVLVVGNPRTSKSSFALRCSEIIANCKKKNFDVEKQLTFDDIKKFLIWSKTAKDSTFILDETGTSLSPEQFWELQQRVMRRFVQTQGFRRNILFWVLPSIIFIQKGFRFMCNYGVQTIRQGVVSTYKIKVDQLRGKGFFSYISTIRFKKPTDKTWLPYFNAKQLWNDENLKADIDYLEQAEKPDVMSLMKQEKLKLSLDLMKARIKKINNQLL